MVRYILWEQTLQAETECEDMGPAAFYGNQEWIDTCY